jgi:hypothetical protein
MKLGFYLSPDGKEIIELKKINPAWVDVVGYDGDFVDVLFDISITDCGIIFSTWEFLGHVE